MYLFASRLQTGIETGTCTDAPLPAILYTEHARNRRSDATISMISAEMQGEKQDEDETEKMATI